MLMKTKFVPSTSGINENLKKSSWLPSLFQLRHVTRFGLEYVLHITHVTNVQLNLNGAIWLWKSFFFLRLYFVFHNKDVWGYRQSPFQFLYFFSWMVKVYNEEKKGINMNPTAILLKTIYGYGSWSGGNLAFIVRFPICPGKHGKWGKLLKLCSCMLSPELVGMRRYQPIKCALLFFRFGQFPVFPVDFVRFNGFSYVKDLAPRDILATVGPKVSLVLAREPFHR